MKEKIGNLSFQSYCPTTKNIIVIGLVLIKKKYAKKDTHFLKYLIYIGRNKGMGLIYPDRRKSNNMVYNVTTMGIISKIILKENEGYEITISDVSSDW